MYANGGISSIENHEGKENKGILPAAVDFSTDLHYMRQLIQEGERTINETVISVEKPNHKVEVPSDAQIFGRTEYPRRHNVWMKSSKWQN
jgi:Glucose-6-phosphate isomerase